MLSEAYRNVRKVYCAVGYTDLRKGIDGLAQIVGTKYDLNPYDKDILFLFCGKKCDRIKGLLWEGTGFLLLYKRLEDGAFVWPRSKEEAAELSEEQYRYLMTGLNPFPKKIREVCPQKVKDHEAEKPISLPCKGHGERGGDCGECPERICHFQ